MTVKDLRILLGTIPEDHAVILASDAEGNYHFPVGAALQGAYDAYSTWSGDFTQPADRTEWNAVVLLPVR